MDVANATCAIINDAIDVFSDFENIQTFSWTSALFFSGLLVASAVVVVRGAKIVRPAAFVAAFFATAGFVYETMRTSRDTACESILIVACACGGVVGFLTWCLFKLALFMLGAIVGGALVHTTFIFVPDEYVSQPSFAGHSVVYYGSLLCAGIVGGCVVRCYSAAVLEIVTAAVGAVGFALSLFALVTTFGTSTHKAPFALISIAVFGIGVTTQRRRRLAARSSSSATGSGVARLRSDGRTV